MFGPWKCTDLFRRKCREVGHQVVGNPTDIFIKKSSEILWQAHGKLWVYAELDCHTVRSAISVVVEWCSRGPGRHIELLVNLQCKLFIRYCPNSLLSDLTFLYMKVCPIKTRQLPISYEYNVNPFQILKQKFEHFQALLKSQLRGIPTP